MFFWWFAINLARVWTCCSAVHPIHTEPFSVWTKLSPSAPKCLYSQIWTDEEEAESLWPFLLTGWTFWTTSLHFSSGILCVRIVVKSTEHCSLYGMWVGLYAVGHVPRGSFWQLHVFIIQTQLGTFWLTAHDSSDYTRGFTGRNMQNIVMG